MKPDQERVRNLLADTVTLLCKNGLQYQKELRVQGLLGITLDDSDVFVVHINETFGDLIGGAVSLHDNKTDVDPVMLTAIDICGETEKCDQTKMPKSILRRRSAEGTNAHHRSKDGEHVARTVSRRSTPSTQDSGDMTFVQRPDYDMRIKRENDLSAGGDSKVRSQSAMKVERTANITYPDSTPSEVRSDYDKYTKTANYENTLESWAGDGPPTKMHRPIRQDFYERDKGSEPDFINQGSGVCDVYPSSDDFHTNAVTGDPLQPATQMYLDDQRDSSQNFSTWDTSTATTIAGGHGMGSGQVESGAEARHRAPRYRRKGSPPSADRQQKHKKFLCREAGCHASFNRHDQLVDHRRRRHGSSRIRDR